MFSPRFLAVFALIATVAAAPSSDLPIPQPVTTITDTDFDFPWFPFGGGWKSFFSPLLQWFPSFGESTPRIEATDEYFRVIMNVKDYKKEDLKVKVKGDYVLVSGSHESKHSDHDLFASQFFHTYSLPQNASASAVTATLYSNDLLVIDCPNSDQPSENNADRDVPIVVSDKPFEKDQAKPTDASAIDKESSTPTADREEVTEKDDNSIPHGENDKVLP